MRGCLTLPELSDPLQLACQRFLLQGGHAKGLCRQCLPIMKDSSCKEPWACTQDCWQPRDEEAIVEARQAMPDSGRKPKSGPKRCTARSPCTFCMLATRALPLDLGATCRTHPGWQTTYLLWYPYSCRYFSEAADEEAFPDLAPGRLSPELREALGIAAGAPPPWLHRMQALGYPPGYRWVALNALVPWPKYGCVHCILA